MKDSNTVILGFGRFQPPTLGHKILIDKIKNLSKESNADYYIYVSKTQGNTATTKLKNPLPIDEKIQFLNKMFPDTVFVATDTVVRTLIEIVSNLNHRYDNLIMVCGSDRVFEFESLLNTYNNVEYHYNQIKVISAGIRDPNSLEVTSYSGTKARTAVLSNDEHGFIRFTGADNSITVNNKTLFQTVKEYIT
jgi:nicotinic acid mononucleotide adenylyltransferase